VLEHNGYTPLGYFVLPEHCWLDAYYRPMQQRFEAFLRRHGGSDAARPWWRPKQAEIELYERYRAFVSYGFYIARKLPWRRAALHAHHLLQRVDDLDQVRCACITASMSL
jgi:hypothetical protein